MSKAMTGAVGTIKNYTGCLPFWVLGRVPQTPHPFVSALVLFSWGASKLVILLTGFGKHRSGL